MRVRVAPLLGPLAETALAYSRLQPRAWPLPARGVAQVGIRHATASDRALASYLWLSPSAGFDLFTLGARTGSIAAGAASVLDAPHDVWSAETDAWAELRAEARRRRLLLPATGGHADVEEALRRGDVDRWRRLLDRMGDYFGSWLRPSWPAIKDRVDAEEARLASHTATAGVQGLFAALGAGIRWTGSSLELSDGGITGSHLSVIQLKGRGLTIVPSFFALQPMVYLPAEVAESALMVVPCPATGASLSSLGGVQPGGAELLGRTRAAVLMCVARGPRTTSQLGYEVGIAVSGASQHAAVLRRAGLITTTREGGHVQHTITELGEGLLARL